MRKSFAVTLLAVMMLFAFSACNNNPAGNIPVGPGMPGWPTGPGTDQITEAEAVAVANGVINSLDRNTVETDIKQAVINFLKSSGDVEGLKRGEISATYNGKEYVIAAAGSSLDSESLITLLTDILAAETGDENSGLLDLISADGINTVLNSLPKMTLSADIIIDGSYDAFNDEATKATNGTITVDVTPVYVAFENPDTPGANAYILADYTISSKGITVSTVNAENEAEEYTIATDGISGVLSAKAIGVTMDELTSLLNSDPFPETLNSKISAQIYMPEKDSDYTLEVEGKEIAWSKLSVFEGSSVISNAVADILPFINVGSERIMNELNRVLGGSEPKHGDFTVSSAAPSKSEIEFVLDFNDYKYTVNDDLVSGDITMTFTVGNDNVATDYSISGTGIKLVNGADASDTLTVDSLEISGQLPAGSNITFTVAEQNVSAVTGTFTGCFNEAELDLYVVDGKDYASDVTAFLGSWLN